MGWTWTNRERGITDRDWFQENVLGESQEIVECATVRFTFYAAVRDKRDDTVWGLVCLTGRQPKDSYFNYGYKDMSDTMGPCEDFAPLRIIDKLTPTDSEYANDWRERCRKNAEQAALARTVKPGMRIRLKHPLSFTDGVERDTFIYRGHNVLTSLDGVRCRVSNWRLRPFEIINLTTA